MGSWTSGFDGISDLFPPDRPKSVQGTTTSNVADNSSPLGRGIPKVIGTSAFTGAIIVDPDHLGGVRLVGGKLIVNLVLAFLDTDLGGPCDLVWLTANDQFIYRAASPQRAAPSAMRVYGGSQTAADGLLVRYLTSAKASCWPKLAYIVLEDFDITPYSENGEIPVFRAAWSSSATASAAEETSTTLAFDAFPGTCNEGTIAYDWQRNVAYFQIFDADDEVWITTVDLSTQTEINRVQLPVQDYGYFVKFVALQGTDFAIAQCYTQNIGGDLYGLRLINCRTGEISATLHALPNPVSGYNEPTMWGAVRLESGIASKFLVIAPAFGPSGAYPTLSQSMLVLADTTNKTLAYVNAPTLVPMRTGGPGNIYSFCVASVSDGLLTGYFTEETPGANVYKLVAGSSGVVSCTIAYTNTESGKNPDGVAYDPLTNSLVILRQDESLISIKLSDGSTNWTVDHSAIPNPVLNNYASESQSPLRPGYGIIWGNGDQPYLVDFTNGSATDILVNSTAWFNQYTGTAFSTGGFDMGTLFVKTLGDLTPNTVDAADILTSLATYQGDYIAGDLTFENFTGGECSGYAVTSDTTIDTCIREVCGVLGIRETHDNGKVKFSFPLRDGAFALDKTLTDADITIDLIEQTIADEDAAMESCEVSYIDPDANFESVAQTYSRPTGLYNVTRSNRRERLNTSLVMTAPQAARVAWRATYESEHERTSYSMKVGPNRLQLEPGDGIAFPFGLGDPVSVAGEIRQAQINPDFTQDLTVAQYMQTLENTFVGTGLITLAPTSLSAYVALDILDLPLLRTSDDMAGAGLRSYALVSGSGAADIPASTVWQSDDGATYAAAATRAAISPITGVMTAFSGAGTGPWVSDYVNTITVQVTSGDINSIEATDEAGRYALTNLAAIGRPGRWVLVSFSGIAVSGQVATLSGLLWGVNGTEVYISQLVAGDRFVLLKPDEVVRLAATVADLNGSIYLKAGYSGFLVSDLGTVLAAQDGEAEKPFAPVTLAYSDAGPTRTITWQFRERLGDLPVIYGAETAGYSETSLAFEIDLYNGVTFVVTLTASAATVNYNTGTYTATKANVYQMSGLGIRGHMGSLTF